MRIRPSEPRWPECDRLILSKMGTGGSSRRPWEKDRQASRHAVRSPHQATRRGGPAGLRALRQNDAYRRAHRTAGGYRQDPDPPGPLACPSLQPTSAGSCGAIRCLLRPPGFTQAASPRAAATGPICPDFPLDSLVPFANNPPRNGEARRPAARISPAKGVVARVPRVNSYLSLFDSLF
jgi:hypothetical protein